jgi:hypothetical protein
MLRKRFFANFLGFLSRLGNFRRSHRKGRVHHYTSYKCGRDYAFDEIQDGSQAYMTAYGYGVKPGDYITICRDKVKIQYKVEQIDYYSNPSDLWIALLVRNQSELL